MSRIAVKPVLIMLPLRIRVVAVACALPLLAGCGSSSPQPKAGAYAGTTSQGEPVALVVAPDSKHLNSLRVQAKYACPQHATAQDSSPRGPIGTAPLDGGSFSGSFTVSGITYRISGSYKSGGQFSGTLSASFKADVGSGNCASGQVSWQARFTTAAPTTPTATNPTATSAARQQLSAAADAYNAGAATFNSRTRADARAGKLAAFKADVAGFRTVLFNFDSSVRRISFPPTAAGQLSALLAADRAEIGDLDAVATAKGAADAVRLYNRAITGTNAVIAAEQALYQAG